MRGRGGRGRLISTLYLGLLFAACFMFCAMGTRMQVYLCEMRAFFLISGILVERLCWNRALESELKHSNNEGSMWIEGFLVLVHPPVYLYVLLCSALTDDPATLTSPVNENAR